MRSGLIAAFTALFFSQYSLASQTEYSRTCDGVDAAGISVDPRVAADCRAAIEAGARTCGDERRRAMDEERRIVGLDRDLATSEGGITVNAKKRQDSYREGMEVFRGNREKCDSVRDSFVRVCNPRVEELKAKIEANKADFAKLNEETAGFSSLQLPAEFHRRREELKNTAIELQRDQAALSTATETAGKMMKKASECFTFLHQIHLDGAEKLQPVVDAGTKESPVLATDASSEAPPGTVPASAPLTDRAKDAVVDHGAPVALKGLGAVVPGPAGEILKLGGAATEKDSATKVGALVGTGLDMAGRYVRHYGLGYATRIVGGSLIGIVANPAPAGQCSDVCASPSVCAQQGCVFRAMSVQSNEAAIQALNQK